jgi:hypothetical protein
MIIHIYDNKYKTYRIDFQYNGIQQSERATIIDRRAIDDLFLCTIEFVVHKYYFDIHHSFNQDLFNNR